MTRGFRWALLTGASIGALGLAAGAASAADLTLQGPGLVGGAPLPAVSSVLSLWAGGALLSSDESDFSNAGYFTFGGDARVAGQAWQLELNAAAHTATDTGDSEEGSSYMALAGHWLNRGPDMTWGLFVGGSGTQEVDTSDWVGHLFGGGEWAGFYGNNTVFAQLGGVVAVLGDVTDSWNSGAFGRAGWRYFFTPDSKFEADVMAGWGRFDSSSDSGWTFAWGAEYEHRFGTTGPFSGFLFYRGHYVEDSSSGCSSCSAIDHVFGVGLRVDVGSGTLLDRDRGPAAAGTFNIPDFHRAFGWPSEL